VTVTVSEPPPEPAAVRKGPYLIYEGSNTSMKVLWQLDNTTDCTINWGLDTSYSLGTADTTEYGTDHQHKYTITGLSPATKYYYEVVDVGTGSFWTAPADSATSVKFIAYGDTRTYPAAHDAVNAQMINTYTNDPEYQTIVLHVGDWIEVDTEADWTSDFFNPTAPNTRDLQANVPINGCMGNHEGSGTVYQKYWPYPYVGGRYWSFDYGPAHIAIVDQYPWSTAQSTWLDSDLANSNKQWKFLVFHEPGWSAKGGHENNKTVQDNIQPLCEQYGVDIVFAGHNHYYARGAVPYHKYIEDDSKFVHHITTGGGGAPLRDPAANEYIVISANTYNFCEINIQGSTLRFTALDEEGSAIDSFVVTHTDLQVSPPEAAVFTGYEGGPFDSDLFTYTITNVGASTFDWTATEGTAWFDISSAGGPLNGGEYATIDVTINSDAESLTPGTHVGAITFSDGADVTITRDVMLIVQGPVEDTANSDIAVSGTVSDSYADTQTSNDTYETITERESGGKPSKRHSYLEHKWTIDVTGGGSVTFYLEAHKTESGEGDDFVFAYSTDDSTYTNMVTVTKTADDDSCQTYVLPSSLSGTVYIRATDTDATEGNNTLDSVSIDRMCIISDAPTQDDLDPPAIPIDLDALAVSSSQIDLSWADNAEIGIDDFSHYEVYRSEGISTAFDEPIASNVLTNSYSDTGLAASTTYNYVVRAVDTSDNKSADSEMDSATTDPADPADETAPTPDPMTWATLPCATGGTSISMTATTASDPSGVEYYFTCTSGGGHDSGWQDSSTYEDTALSPNTSYTYTVKARDKSPNQNETGVSSIQSATTEDQQTISVASVEVAIVIGKKYKATATVAVDPALEGATVVGDWYFKGAIRESSASGTTGSDGTVDISTSFETPAKSGDEFKFVVTDVVGSYVYYPDDNLMTEGIAAVQ